MSKEDQTWGDIIHPQESEDDQAWGDIIHPQEEEECEEDDIDFFGERVGLQNYDF